MTDNLRLDGALAQDTAANGRRARREQRGQSAQVSCCGEAEPNVCGAARGQLIGSLKSRTNFKCNTRRRTTSDLSHSRISISFVLSTLQIITPLMLFQVALATSQLQLYNGHEPSSASYEPRNYDDHKSTNFQLVQSGAQQAYRKQGPRPGASYAPREPLERPSYAGAGEHSVPALSGGLEVAPSSVPNPSSYDSEPAPTAAASSSADYEATDEAGAESEEGVPSNGADDRRGDSMHMLDQHNLHLRAMHDMFERRQLLAPNNQQANGEGRQHAGAPLQSSQELSPISIGLEPGAPFALGSPFSMGGASHEPVPPPLSAHPHKPHMSAADNLDPPLPFGLGPLPHLLGFQGGPAASGFDGPQRGDQSAHSNQHASAPPADPEAPGPSQKVWPKIFRFTDGRINLSDFEKQKKIRLSNKNQHAGENHIESAPIMFDGRQLKRKSFLILHGGIFARR